MEESGYYALANADHMSVFLICIRNKQGELSGNIVNLYLKEPVEFTDILDLGLKIDTLCARLHRPMATTGPRFLDVRMKRAYEKRELGREHIPLKYCTKIQSMNRLIAIGTAAYETLVIKIHQQQFSNMQGHIKGKCAEGNYISFRGTLGLMRMLREHEYMRNGMDERTDKMSGQWITRGTKKEGETTKVFLCYRNQQTKAYKQGFGLSCYCSEA